MLKSKRKVLSSEELKIIMHHIATDDNGSIN